MTDGLAAVAVAFVVTLAATPAVVHALRRRAVMDVPNARSSHDRPTVRGGGVAPLAGAAVALAAIAPVPASERWLVLVVALGLGALGFVDDIKHLPPAIRLAATIGLAGVPISILIDRPLGLAPAAGVAVAALAVAAYVNAFNFMDGINGISALQAMTAGVLLSAGGAIAGVEIVVVAGLAIAAAGAGFLRYNFPRAVVFLGDVGSYGIGGWLAVLGIIAAAEVSPVLPISLAAVYGADTAATVLRRLRRGERIWDSHREHTYQRLCGAGWSHTASALTVTGFTALCGLIGLAGSRHGPAVGTLGLTAVAAVCLGYLSLPARLAHGPAPRQRMSLG